MKKLFPFENPPHKPPRVIAAIKSDVRKYIKRERRKELPEGVDFWDFDCRTGKDAQSADDCHVNELTTAIDTAAGESWPAIYIEILSKPGRRATEKDGKDEGAT